VRHKVLIVEKSDTTRSVAESTLRQNGYEVISLDSADTALEVINLSRPHLALVGADLVTSDRISLFEKILQNPETSNLPVLLFASEDGSDSGFPEEIVISRPLDIHDFLNKISIFIGRGDSPKPEKASGDNASEVNDDFLDAALGLDHIDVTDSEVMDKTSYSKKNVIKSTATHLAHIEEDMNQSRQVESLIIQEESGPIQQKKSSPPKTVEGSGKLDIADNQYDLNELNEPSTSDDSAHDYDWFVNSMQDENSQKPLPGGSGNKKGTGDSGKLSFTDPAAVVDPNTPGPGAVKSKRDKNTVGGVEEFIDEFKKEIEQLRVDQPKEFDTDPGESKKHKPTVSNGNIDNISINDVDMFTREFAQELGHSIAKLVVEKIDADRLLEMIKKEIVDRYHNKK